MRDVLMNLLDNAVKFTNQGGITISIELELEKVTISIKDTGTGVSQEDLPKLFHKFGRIDNSYTIASDTGGTGLGLYIAKLYIEGMGGKVWATSEGKNKGSTFLISIPKSKIKTGTPVYNIQPSTSPTRQITSIR